MILLIMTYPGGNDTLVRHWSYFLKSGADEIWIVTTEDDNDLSKLPANVTIVKQGKNSYIDGSHLPQRLIDTIKIGLGNKTKFEYICVSEFDCVFFRPLQLEAMEHGIAGHYAGGPTWGSKAKGFYHPPWLFRREAAQRFVECGQRAIDTGICSRNRGEASSPESSPDVFVGYCSEQYNIPIQGDLWKEYSRNSFDLPGHLEEARQAYRDGVTVIHGIKSQFELDYILNGSVILA